MDAHLLVENMIIWFGTRVDKETYEDYLDTYLDLSKPDHLPLFAYKLFFSQAKTKIFGETAAKRGVKVIQGKVNKTH